MVDKQQARAPKKEARASASAGKGGAAAEKKQKAAPPRGEVSLVASDIFVRYRTTRDSSRSRNLLARLSGERVDVNAVRGISLVAHEGEFIGVVGRNGSGKSTLLRTLAGLETPTRGDVYAAAKPILLGVSAAMVRELSGAQNIRLGCLAMGMTPEDAEAVHDQVVELSALGEAIDLPLMTYSSGMASRLKFAISLAANPKILMIDEALATGDATFAERSEQAMNDLLERSGTVFLVNHAPQVIERLCTRAVWLDQGRVVLDGEAKDVTLKYRRFALSVAKGHDALALKRLNAALEEGNATRIAASADLPDSIHSGRKSGKSGKRARKEIESDDFSQLICSSKTIDRVPSNFPGSDLNPKKKE